MEPAHTVNCPVCQKEFAPHHAYRFKAPVCDPHGYCGGYYEGRAEAGLFGALEDVDEFTRAIPDSLIQDRGDNVPALTRRVMRWRLLKEEFEELEAAIMENDVVEVADAYADIVYITLGSAIMHIGKARFSRVWDEVQRSNMAKLVDGKIVMREDGKVLKPEGWTAPDIKAVFG